MEPEEAQTFGIPTFFQTMLVCCKTKKKKCFQKHPEDFATKSASVGVISFPHITDRPGTPEKPKIMVG